jgi:hypothetical protein
MKAALVLLIALAASGAAAQTTTNSSSAAAIQTSTPRRAPADQALTKPSQPIQIVSGSFSYSGIAVQAVKVSHPLQLVNPFAPAEYGSGEVNLSRDIITGKPSGLKVFSIKF